MVTDFFKTVVGIPVFGSFNRKHVFDVANVGGVKQIGKQFGRTINQVCEL